MVKRSDLSELEAVLYKAPRPAFDQYLTLRDQRDELLDALEAISVMVAASKSSSYEARLTAALDMLDWARLTASAALDAATKEETE